MPQTADEELPEHSRGERDKPQGSLRARVCFQPRRPGALACKVREEYGLVQGYGRAGKKVIVTAEAKVGAGKVERITADLQIMGFKVTTKDV